MEGWQHWEELALVWVLGCAGIFIGYTALFGGVSKRTEKKLFVGLLAVIGLWSAFSLFVIIKGGFQ